MTVSQLVLTGIQRQTRCEKHSKDTEQNTVTPHDPYFFTPIKATDNLERNKGKGQVQSQAQNSCILRSDEVGQEDEQEWIWQNSSKSWVPCSGWRVDDLFAQHSAQELWGTKVSKHVSQNKIKEVLFTHIAKFWNCSLWDTVDSSGVTRAQGGTGFTEQQLMETYETQTYPLWIRKSEMWTAGGWRNIPPCHESILLDLLFSFPWAFTMTAVTAGWS